MGACGGSSDKAGSAASGAATTAVSSGSGTSVSVASTLATTATSAASVSTKPAVAGAVPDLCALVTKTDVESALQLHVADVQSKNGATASDCAFSLGTDPTKQVELDVKWTRDFLTRDKANALGLTTVPVPALGAAAWFTQTGSVGHVQFRGGDLTIQILGSPYGGVLSATDAEQAKSIEAIGAIGKIVLSKS